MYRGFSEVNKRMANSVDPDEMAHYEQSYLDLHCLQRYLYWCVRDERGKVIFSSKKL